MILFLKSTFACRDMLAKPSCAEQRRFLGGTRGTAPLMHGLSLSSLMDRSAVGTGWHPAAGEQRWQRPWSRAQTGAGCERGGAGLLHLPQAGAAVGHPCSTSGLAVSTVGRGKRRGRKQDSSGGLYTSARQLGEESRAGCSLGQVSSQLRVSRGAAAPYESPLAQVLQPWQALGFHGGSLGSHGCCHWLQGCFHSQLSTSAGTEQG